ncbi:circadian clock KaiB family protein [Adhaeribacter sp. BT258]|uniref:Circadian clock KaiB family protein n=2 Tax=Adhaeribacter terrigena TaxID=2793070 RepID=A0ABS1C348_9BACT|nr:circadian clock KaiB family protein [Adhaeribacter terrigena]
MNKYVLQLFINGNSLTSMEAVEMLQAICKENLKGNCELEIVDIQVEPQRAEEAGILAIPTLVRKWPLPETRIIGALSVKTRVLTGLGIASDKS